MKTTLAIVLTSILVLSSGLLSPCLSIVNVSPLGITCDYDPDGDPVERTLTLANTGEEDVSFFIRVSAEDWGEGEEELAGPRRDLRGDPDEMTWEWRDSDEDDGPNFEWIDITELEDVIEVGNVLDDSYHGMWELGFEFELWGEVYDEVGMHSNGWAAFVLVQDVLFYYPNWERLPNANGNPAPPPTLMAANHQDINPFVGGNLYYWTDGESIAVLTWQDVPHWVDLNNEQATWTFQIVIMASGLIKYQYLETGIYDNDTIMIGIQNEDRDMGFTMIFQDFDYLEDEMAIAIGPEGAWVTWLRYAPAEGQVGAGEEMELTLTLDAADLEDGVYYANVLINTDQQEQPQVRVPVIMSLNSPVGSVAGTVIDAANDEPVPGAAVTIIPSELMRFTDEEGAFAISDLPAGEYTLIGSHPDYFDFVIENLEIVEGEEADGSMEFLHAECTPDHERLVAEVAPDDETEVSFSVFNGGNAPLTFTTERRLPGGADADPWELRESFLLSDSLDDFRLEGVVWINDHFYVSGANDNSPVIYKLNSEGALVDSIVQPGDDRRGMRDLSYGNGLIWGAVRNQVYGMDLNGEVRVNFESEFNPTSCITYDPVNDWIWCSSTTTNIVGYDMNGDRQAELSREGLRIYGLGYWPDDPDGYPLYVFNKDAENEMQTVHKYDIENVDMQFVTYLEPERGGSPGGLYITNTYDVYSWVFMNMVNAPGEVGGDRIDIWQLASRLDWFVLDPDEGVIRNAEDMDFTLTFSAFEMPPNQYNGEIVFLHDGTGGETVIPVTLSVVEGPVEADRRIFLEMGWSIVSANLQPEDDDVVVITQGLVDNELLLMMKDGFGNFYLPEAEFNNIPGWDVAQGYQFKMAEESELVVHGITVTADEPISLTQGWNMIAYYPRIEVDAIIALSRIEEQLIIAKDGYGNFYKPDWEFSNMGNMMEARGYQAKVTEDLNLVYALEEENLDAAGRARSVCQAPGRLPAHPVTGSNMSLLILADGLAPADPSQQYEVGVYADGKLVGSGVIRDGRCGIAVWGDDVTTGTTDGALDGQALDIVLFDSQGEREATFTSLQGEGLYRTDGLWMVELESVEVTPSEFGITAAYPNPFNHRTRIGYYLPETGAVDLAVYDLSGRQVAEIVSGEQENGLHHVTFDAENLASGVYVLGLESISGTSRMKLILLK